MISFADMDSSPFSSADDSENLFFADDHVLDVVDPDLGAGVLADEHAVAGLDLRCDPLAVVVQSTRSDGHDLPLQRFLLGRVRDDDAALRLLLGLDSLDQHTVVQWFHLHAEPPCKDWNSSPDHFFGSSRLRRLLALTTIEC